MRAPLPSSRQGVGGVGISLPPADTIKHDKGHTTALQESSSSWEAKLCCFSTGLLGLGRDDQCEFLFTKTTSLSSTERTGLHGVRRLSTSTCSVN